VLVLVLVLLLVLLLACKNSVGTKGWKGG